MVLETIDTAINNGEQLATDTNKVAVNTEAETPAEPEVAESRDAALAPCDSMRNYANELAASKDMTISQTGSTGEQRAEAPTETGTAEATEELVKPKAADAVAEEEEPTVANDKPAPELPVEKAQSTPRVTLITVTADDECKMDSTDPEAPAEMQRNRSEESHESVEIVAEEEEPLTEQDSTPAEAMPDAEVNSNPEDTTPVEEESKPVEEIADATPTETDDKPVEESMNATPTETEEKPAEEDSKEEEPQVEKAADEPAEESSGKSPKKKKFGLKLSMRKFSPMKKTTNKPKEAKEEPAPTAAVNDDTKVEEPKQEPEAEAGINLDTKADEPKQESEAKEAKEEPAPAAAVNDDTKVEEPKQEPEADINLDTKADEPKQESEVEAQESNKDDAPGEDVAAADDKPQEATDKSEPSSETTPVAAPTSEAEKEETNMYEMLYSKVGNCFGLDIDNICGAKPHEEESQPTSEDSTALGTDPEDATTAKRERIIDTNVDEVLEDITTPFSIATECATSFIDSIKESQSYKSFVDSVTNLTGADAAASKEEEKKTPKKSFRLFKGGKAKKEEEITSAKEEDAPTKEENEATDKADPTEAEEEKQEKTPKKSSGLKIFAPKKTTPKKHLSSRPTSLLKRGFGLAKKSSMRRFKSLGVLGKKGGKTALPPTKELVDTEGVQEDLAALSLNSQSLNEPCLTNGETKATSVEDKPATEETSTSSTELDTPAEESAKEGTHETETPVEPKVEDAVVEAENPEQKVEETPAEKTEEASS